MTIANDSGRANLKPTHGAGRDVWKSIRTTAGAVAKGDYAQARNAARYAFPRLGITVPVPASDDAAVWGHVLIVMTATAEGLDLAAIAARRAAFS
jgi:hypothetical protein